MGQPLKFQRLAEVWRVVCVLGGSVCIRPGLVCLAGRVQAFAGEGQNGAGALGTDREKGWLGLPSTLLRGPPSPPEMASQALAEGRG